jgi:hypothetical protein
MGRWERVAAGENHGPFGKKNFGFKVHRLSGASMSARYSARPSAGRIGRWSAEPAGAWVSGNKIVRILIMTGVNVCQRETGVSVSAGQKGQ